jgi:hypothetical protein
MLNKNLNLNKGININCNIFVKSKLNYSIDAFGSIFDLYYSTCRILLILRKRNLLKSLKLMFLMNQFKCVETAIKILLQKIIGIPQKILF